MCISLHRQLVWKKSFDFGMLVSQKLVQFVISFWNISHFFTRWFGLNQTFESFLKSQYNTHYLFDILYVLSLSLTTSVIWLSWEDSHRIWVNQVVNLINNSFLCFSIHVFRIAFFVFNADVPCCYDPTTLGKLSQYSLSRCQRSLQLWRNWTRLPNG